VRHRRLIQLVAGRFATLPVRHLDVSLYHLRRFATWTIRYLDSGRCATWTVRHLDVSLYHLRRFATWTIRYLDSGRCATWTVRHLDVSQFWTFRYQDVLLPPWTFMFMLAHLCRPSKECQDLLNLSQYHILQALRRWRNVQGGSETCWYRNVQVAKRPGGEPSR